MNQLKIFVNDLIKVSKLTKTKNKKIRIFITGIISNLIVLLDILIILSFTNVFSDDISIDNFITIFLFDNIYLLPLLVILRFSCIYYEKINITKLRLEVEENLRDQLIEEIFRLLKPGGVCYFAAKHHCKNCNADRRTSPHSNRECQKYAGCYN